MSFFRFTILILFLIPSLSHAYQPGRWYHTDPYVISVHEPRLKRIEVTDSRGSIMKKAEYKYRSDGLLEYEIYYTADGRKEGITRFEYDSNGRPESETLMDHQDKTLSKRIYSYKKNMLIATEVYDESNRKVIKQEYVYRDQKIVGGTESTEGDESKFRFLYNGSLLSEVTVLNDDGSVLSKVTYTYDKQKRLKERERAHLETHSLCKYQYNGKTLKSYTFYVGNGKTWKEDKTITLFY